MRDKIHMEGVERWALFVKNNPDKWKKIHTQFINDQFQKAYDFYDRLKDAPGGKEKLIRLFGKT